MKRGGKSMSLLQNQVSCCTVVILPDFVADTTDLLCAKAASAKSGPHLSKEQILCRVPYTNIVSTSIH